MSARPPEPALQVVPRARPSSSFRRIATTSRARASRVDRVVARIVADRLLDVPAEAAGREDDPGAGQGQPLPRAAPDSRK